METNVLISVYRRLDNRFEGLSDDSPRGLELHELRKNALHEIFDNQNLVKVTDWGKTDDVKSHELVEILVGIILTGLIKPILIKGLEKIGEKLIEKAVDESVTEAIKWIISKIIKKQKEKKILDCSIKLKNGISITINPPQGTSDVTIRFNNGEEIIIKY